MQLVHLQKVHIGLQVYTGGVARDPHGCSGTRDQLGVLLNISVIGGEGPPSGSL